MSKENLIICGPWIGEFAYELNYWAPKLRYYINKEYPGYKTAILTSPGRSLLYRDFIDEYVPFPKEVIDNMPPTNSGGAGHGNQHSLEHPLTEQFLQDFIKDNKEKYENIYQVRPKDLECVTRTQVIHDHQFKHADHKLLQPDPVAEKAATDFLIGSFLNNSKTIAIMAPTVHEIFPVRENWKVDNWLYFIERLINELDFNIVMTGIKSRKLPNGIVTQGSYTFEDTYLYDKYPDKIKSYVQDEGGDSLDAQVSILRNTSCSIWGSTGATHLGFYCGKPVFAQLVYGQLSRLTMEWQKKLTNNHEHVKFIHKYKSGEELYNSSAEELFNEFNLFYNKLDN
tara:strand:+ start:14132 stop:15151 length:1020 start_codon:yes stop_codon:yes gene_type:complete